jgi:multicomponent Na+:H+ antiporter subunit E
MSAEPSVTPAAQLDSPRRAGFARGAAFFLLWLVMMPSAKPGDLAIGALSAIAATWVSLRLMPSTAGCIKFGALAALLPHFFRETVHAGIDVARRTLAPTLRLEPGFVRCPLDFPPGFARNTFATITSLIPGTVPSGEDDGVMVYHCLDTTQPVVEQLWQEERLLSRALVAGRRHD